MIVTDLHAVDWHHSPTPAGPRRPGEGVENEEQGILSAEEVPTTG